VQEAARYGYSPAASKQASKRGSSGWMGGDSKVKWRNANAVGTASLLCGGNTWVKMFNLWDV
jgi:hypothetical protein